MSSRNQLLVSWVPTALNRFAIVAQLLRYDEALLFWLTAEQHWEIEVFVLTRQGFRQTLHLAGNEPMRREIDHAVMRLDDVAGP